MSKEEVRVVMSVLRQAGVWMLTASRAEYGASEICPDIPLFRCGSKLNLEANTERHRGWQ
jgi:hypothetical protein